MNDSVELFLIKVAWIFAGLGFIFENLKEISSIMVIVATIPVVIQRYSPLVVRMGYRLNKVINKILKK